MDIKFFSGFSKRYNSTKVPLVADATKTYTGYLKEPCSITNPVFRVERPLSDATPYSYTYAYIGNFGRWYFVNDWIWVDGLWECHLTEDVLATYKTQIGNSSEYVLRTDSTSDYNGAISDMMYPATTDFSIEKVPIQNPFTEILSDGTYIVGIISGDQTDSVGAITYYAMDSTEFGNLKSKLFSDDNLEIMGIIDSGGASIADVSQEVVKTMYNPYQYIASCLWFPIEKTDIPGSAQTTIKIGWWPYNLSGKRLSTQAGLFREVSTELPVHPQSTRGKYLNYAPYTRMTLYGKFGSIPIDTSYLEIGHYLIGEYYVDYITGECVYIVYASEFSTGIGRVEITKTTFLIGVPIQIAQVGTDYLGTISNALSSVSNGIAGGVHGLLTSGPVGAITGAVASVSSGIYNTIDSAMPQLVTSGANGSFANSQFSTVLIIIHFRIAEEDLHHKGRPLCDTRQLQNLSGFVMCAEGEIELNCLDEERRMIAEYLTSGFFME